MRRGQLTIFIILGLVVLLAVGVVLYFTATQVVFRGGTLVPREAQPVYDFVSACASSIAQDGIILQGAQGGYLSLPRDIERTPTAYVPLDSQGVLKVPLWFYEGNSRIPTLALLEADLGNYVENNLESCLQNFSAFKDQYPVVEKSPPKVQAVISDAGVTLKITYPIAIQRQDKTIDVQDFVVEEKVLLKQAYELAVKTMQREDRDAWFENLTMDLMTADPAIPFDALTFDCSEKTWRLTDIRTEMQEVLRVNLPAIRVQNTVTAPFQEKDSAYVAATKFKLDDFFLGRTPAHTPDDVFEYQRQRLDVGIPKSSLAAAFTYNPAWGLDVNGEPNRGGVLSSKLTKGAAQYLSFLCTNFYHFSYDVIYPVVMTVRDPNAFLGAGFTFQFAFPVIINGNEGARKSFGYSQFQGFETSQGFCDNLGNQVVEVRASGLEPDIGVVEQPDVTVDYQCVTQFCTLGTTRADNGFYRLVTRLPEGCSTPFITASKDGYLPVTVPVRDSLVQVTLPRLRETHVNVLKHPYDLASKKFLDPQPLSEGENVTLFVHVQNTTFDQFITFPSGNNTVELVDGTATYGFNAVLTLFGDLVGGYQTENLTVRGRDLDGRDTLTLHVVEVVPATQSDQYRADTGTFLQSGTYADMLKPTFT